MAVLLLAGSASADVFKVGSGASCTHATVQSAINSAAANGPDIDIVRIATNLTYAQQALTINGHLVVMQGGYANCDATEPTAGVRTVLFGSGGVAKPVLELTGTQGNLFLFDINLREGDQIATAKGGGLAISGSNHFVKLTNVSIQGNRAGDGGGIAITGAVGSGNEIDLGNAVLISGNSASGNGGGIYCQNAKLTMVTTNGTIISNGAVSNGGGIYADRCDVRLANSSPAALISNTARFGGGLFASNATKVELYSLSAAALTHIYGNTAEAGGGMYIQEAQVDANEIVWVQNAALSGAVAFVATGLNGTEMRLNDRAITGAPLVCAVGTVCSEWRENRAVNSDGTLTAGSSGIRTVGLPVVRLNRVSIHGNLGGPVLDSSGGLAANVHLRNSEIYNNVSVGTAGIITGVGLLLEHLSIGGNTVNAPALINGRVSNTTLRMIAGNQPGKRLAAQTETGVIDGQYLIANDLTGIPPTVNNLQQDPLFVSDTDLRLQLASPAIDYGNTSISGVDLLGRPRPVDITSIPNEFGAVDVGAYEMSNGATEAIFANGFE